MSNSKVISPTALILASLTTVGLLSAFYYRNSINQHWNRKQLRALLKNLPAGHSIENRCLGMLVATAVGDAKGIPYECKTYERIQQVRKELEVTGKVYEKCSTHELMDATFPLGGTTDDTQLSLAVAKALVSAKQFNMEEMAKQHVIAWSRTTAGWGSSTRNSIASLANGSKTFRDSGNLIATGNGVIMKIAPLIMYYHVLHMKSPISDWTSFRENMIRDIEIFAKMTHATPVSVVTGCLLGLLTFELYEHPDKLDTEQSRKEVLKMAISIAIELEDRFIPKSFQVDGTLDQPKQQKQLKTVEKISPRLIKMMDSWNELHDDRKLVEISDGGSSFSVHSLTMVIGVLVSQSPGFDSILRAAYIGGDTDSNAAIVGAVIGGMKGLIVGTPKEMISWIPNDYIEQLHDNTSIINQSLQLGEFLKDMLLKQ